MSDVNRKELVNKVVQKLIAQYLQKHSLDKTLDLFQLELNTTFNSRSDNDEIVVDEDLDSIVGDRINFNRLSVLDDSDDSGAHLNTFTPQHLQNIEKYQVKLPHFQLPFPSESRNLPIHPVRSLVIHSNYLEVNFEGELRKLLLFTCADRSIVAYDIEKDQVLVDFKDSTNHRLIFSFQDYILTCNMNGELIFWKLHSAQDQLILVKKHLVKLHNRLITSLKVVELGEFIYIVSIGFDFKLCLTKLHLNDWSSESLGSTRFMTNPTCLAIHKSTMGDKTEFTVIVGLMESSLLQVFQLRDETLKLLYKIALNDSEFNHHSFYPTSVLVQNNLIVVGTNHMPYMRLITAHIPDPTNDDSSTEIKRDLVVSNINTMSSQDKFSNTVVLPRPHGGGVVIISDDGIIRGVSLKDGKIIEMANIGSRSKTLCITLQELICTCSVDKEIKLISVR